MVFGWGWHLLFCARAKRDERKVVSDAVWHGAGIKDKKGPPPPKDQRPKTKQKAWEKSVEKKRKQRKGKKGVEKKKRKTTAPRIPAWSPTVVLTGRHSG